MRTIEQLIKEHKNLTKGIVNYDKHAFYVSTFHSTAIEGSTLTEGQVIDLLSYGKTSPKKPFQDHLMVMDHYQAMIYTINLAKNKIPLSIKNIQEIGALVMKNTGSTINTALGTYDISKGEFRKSSVYAGRRQFPDAKKVNQMVSILLLSINKEIQKVKTVEDKLKLAFKIHFEFVSIHPFGDGNGRVSRLLMNYVQQYFNLPTSIVFKNSRIKYIEALEASRKTESLEPFYKFMFSEYSKFLKIEISKH